MTYCVGLVLDSGLVLASDSRTNAGVDYVTTFSKMHVIKPAPDRLFVLLSAGNLATTQEVMNRLQRDLDTGGTQGNLLSVRYMFEAAEYVGRISVEVQNAHGPAMQASGVSAETTLILGGQIQGQPHSLFMIYPQGNYFAASAETPFLQIGENKYGKPVLDRLARHNMTLEDGARLLMMSLDATSRSNVTVGPPFEVSVYPADSLQLSQHLKMDQSHPWLKQARRSWQEGLQRVFSELPRFDWETGSSNVTPLQNQKPDNMDSS